MFSLPTNLHFSVAHAHNGVNPQNDFSIEGRMYASLELDHFGFQVA